VVTQYVADLERLVSQARLDRYRPTNRDDLQTAINYLWNVALSEALLQSLSAVEIGLRNTMHTALTAREGSEYWFWGVLVGQELENFNKEWCKLATNQKRLPTAGKVIAHQSFGFWHKLFESKYDPLWSQDRSRLLKAAFPNHPHVGVLPADWLTRNKIQSYIKLFLDLRNRAMHHEPIFQGLARPDETQPGQPVRVESLVDAHAKMTEFLNWMDPQLSLSLRVVDRFDNVNMNGKAQIRWNLETEIIRLYGHL
jgi:hypothetical protein